MDTNDTDNDTDVLSIFNISLSQAARTVEDALQSTQSEFVPVNDNVSEIGTSNVGNSRKRHLSENGREVVKPKRKATMAVTTNIETGKNVKKNKRW
ncbi:hypothetical protein DPMN_055002 [Dreissena polymorpha]|uniref:Uncharacterized protein n=1 Tax=Dreissena polymorpha TaxID=45954 RepID=A0A9D4HRU7_DREPO|nr:hypothetical protein DPMN_055002 [Dreissena polymorpha]